MSLFGPNVSVFTKILLWSELRSQTLLISCTSFVFPLLHKFRFWQCDRGFSHISLFFLTGCHCLSAHGNKSFSICHFYLSLHLLLILHCFLPPCFPPSSALIFLPFWPFFNQTSALFQTFWRVSCIFGIFSSLGCFYSGPQLQNIFWLRCNRGLFFFLRVFTAHHLWPLTSIPKMHFFSSKWPPASSRGRDCELVSC